MWLESGLIFIITVLVVLIVREILRPAPPPPVIVKKDPPPKKDPIKLTPTELLKHNGENDTPIYVCIQGDIFDVTSGKQNYGPGGAYSIFAGHDATFALGKSSLVKEDLDKPYDTLTPAELDTALNWKGFFENKYERVGTLVK